MYNKIVRPSLKTKKWEKFRDKILRKYNYLCQESLLVKEFFGKRNEKGNF